MSFEPVSHRTVLHVQMNSPSCSLYKLYYILLCEGLYSFVVALTRSERMSTFNKEDEEDEEDEEEEGKIDTHTL